MALKKKGLKSILGKEKKLTTFCLNSPFPTMFSKGHFHMVVKIVWLHFSTQSQLLTTLKKRALENFVGKGENVSKQHFLLFPQCFLLYQKEKLSF